MALVIGWRFILHLPFPTALRVILFIAVLLVAECHLIYRLLFGNIFSPEFPQPMMVAINALFGAEILFTLLLLIQALIGGIARLAGHPLTGQMPVSHGLLIISLLVAGYAAWQAVKVPAVKNVTVNIAHLPPAFEGYRLVQLTDLHASSLLRAGWMAQVVQRTNALQPDLITMTGDIADGTVENRRADVAPLKQLHARDGVLAIPGNHEYYVNFSAWMKETAALGMQELLNQSVRIYRGNQSIVVAGVTDEAALRFSQPGPALSEALQGVSAGDTLILLDHRPVNARQNAAAGADLQLSGHTHGGMVPGLDLLVKRANHGFYSGEYRLGRMLLYVSNGTGLWNGFALRLGHPSEITLFTLQKG
ncbi:metallophosphoesterase [Tatumella sp. JGM100]|nr:MULTISPECIES: metallophosphoesterase [unclassified Tatumella]MBS0856745.1 metallophosphoesterase [Tatumella sp. JGM16]MBS0877753.1 metallophosphoesterase [Tatumella sp. JGM82]MBS0891458.1 metallophosphoesterase [Tatumella sp. JGM94]MBS0894448.1 metallophosphoesterase [Tatumella sp. JGM130]MBS0902388.1 metallophosphoesterase [Tatumella sp. JGM100]